MSHQPQPCPFCHGFGGRDYQATVNGPRHVIKCPECRGTGKLWNGTLPGIEPAPPPPTRTEEKHLDAGQERLF